MTTKRDSINFFERLYYLQKCIRPHVTYLLTRPIYVLTARLRFVSQFSHIEVMTMMFYISMSYD